METNELLILRLKALELRQRGHALIASVTGITLGPKISKDSILNRAKRDKALADGHRLLSDGFKMRMEYYYLLEKFLGTDHWNM